MPDTRVRVAHEANDSMFTKGSPEHTWINKVIKQTKGLIWKWYGFEDFEEDWKRNFLDHWQETIDNKRLTSSEVAAWRADAAAKKLPPSMRGDSKTPLQLRHVKEQDFKSFKDQRLFILYVRHSGKAGANIEGVLISAMNQFRDFQDRTNLAGRVLCHITNNTPFDDMSFPIRFIGRLQKLVYHNCQVHLFGLGLEGLYGNFNAYKDLTSKLTAACTPDNLGNLTAARTPDNLGNLAKFQLILSCHPQEVEANDEMKAWPGTSLEISDGTNKRIIINFGLLSLPDAGPDAMWLADQFGLRVMGRQAARDANLSLNQKRALKLDTKRRAASMNVRRNALYGRMNMVAISEEDLE